MLQHYLLHNHVIAIVGSITEPFLQSSSYEARLAVETLILAPAVLATGAIYFRLMERPCMKPDWPSRLRGTLRSQ